MVHNTQCIHSIHYVHGCVKILLLFPTLMEEIFSAVKISKSQNLKIYIAMHCAIWRHLAPARVMRRASGHSQGLGGDAEWRRGEERGNLES